MSENPTFWSSITEHWEIARTLRHLRIQFDAAKCSGVWQCYGVCPVGCWTPNHETRKVEFHDPDGCIACGACVLQCPEGAITLK
jgi:NAD-dependent dihydropyrimidine dehydrogenase PreA subunit